MPQAAQGLHLVSQCCERPPATWHSQKVLFPMDLSGSRAAASRESESLHGCPLSWWGFAVSLWLCPSGGRVGWPARFQPPILEWAAPCVVSHPGPLSPRKPGQAEEAAKVSFTHHAFMSCSTGSGLARVPCSWHTHTEVFVLQRPGDHRQRTMVSDLFSTALLSMRGAAPCGPRLGFRTSSGGVPLSLSNFSGAVFIPAQAL